VRADRHLRELALPRAGALAAASLSRRRRADRSHSYTRHRRFRLPEETLRLIMKMLASAAVSAGTFVISAGTFVIR
jgi:hypothetical protein